MAYLTQLDWLKQLTGYSEEKRKVLLALSHEKYLWRSKEKISTVTGLSDFEVDSILSDLMSEDKVRASLSKKKNVIFGLRERVD